MAEDRKEDLAAWAELVKETLSEKFLEFRLKPRPMQRGFQVIDPVDRSNLPFLCCFKGRTRFDSINGGVVVAALGFGNLDDEIEEAGKVIDQYKEHLEKKGLAAEVIFNGTKDPIVKRGAYVFVPLEVD